jgi:hypothetical protein
VTDLREPSRTAMGAAQHRAAPRSTARHRAALQLLEGGLVRDNGFTVVDDAGSSWSASTAPENVSRDGRNRRFLGEIGVLKTRTQD